MQDKIAHLFLLQKEVLRIESFNKCYELAAFLFYSKFFCEDIYFCFKMYTQFLCLDFNHLLTNEITKVKYTNILFNIKLTLKTMFFLKLYQLKKNFFHKNNSTI